MEAGRVDRSGHIDRSLIGREIENVRLREAVDEDVAGPHTNRARVSRSRRR